MEKQREYRNDNREKVLENVRNYYNNNKDRLRAYLRNWRAENKEMASASYQAARARRSSSEGSFTAKEVDELLETQEGLCAWCNKPLSYSEKRYHKHHKHPLGMGGTNYIWNIELVHHECHISTQHKQKVAEFME
jgi:hypothetical protein